MSVAPQPASGYPRCYPREGHLRKEGLIYLTLYLYGANIVLPLMGVRAPISGSSCLGYPQTPCVKNTMNYPQLTEKMSHLEKVRSWQR